jgi:hypothetical protein
MAYKDHTSIYAYKAFYDAATDKYDIRVPSLPFIINTAHVVLIEVIEE